MSHSPFGLLVRFAFAGQNMFLLSSISIELKSRNYFLRQRSFLKTLFSLSLWIASQSIQLHLTVLQASFLCGIIGVRLLLFIQLVRLEQQGEVSLFLLPLYLFAAYRNIFSLILKLELLSKSILTCPFEWILSSFYLLSLQNQRVIGLQPSFIVQLPSCLIEYSVLLSFRRRSTSFHFIYYSLPFFPADPFRLSTLMSFLLCYWYLF